MPVPAQCQVLFDEIEALKRERADLQTQLRSAPTGEKPPLASGIKHLNFLINAKKPALDACVAQYGPPPRVGPPSPQPLAASLIGTASITTDGHFTGEPFVTAVGWGLLFDAARAQVFITMFPDWMINTTAMANVVAGFFAGIFGPNITTIRLTSVASGLYIKPTGTWIMPLKLRFDQSRDIPIYEEDSDLSLVLSTANPGGSPVTTAGLVTLSGTGGFVGGWLGGAMGTIVVTGTLTPVP